MGRETLSRARLLRGESSAEESMVCACSEEFFLQPSCSLGSSSVQHRHLDVKKTKKASRAFFRPGQLTFRGPRHPMSNAVTRSPIRFVASMACMFQCNAIDARSVFESKGHTWLLGHSGERYRRIQTVRCQKLSERPLAQKPRTFRQHLAKTILIFSTPDSISTTALSARGKDSGSSPCHVTSSKNA